MGFFVSKPCPMRLEDMTKNGDGWHCRSCNKTVVDLTRETAEDVAGRLAAGPICGRGRATPGGRLILAGAAALGISGLARADGNVPIPPIPEEDTTEVCDGDGKTGTDDTSSASDDAAAGDGPDEHGGKSGKPVAEPERIEHFVTMGIVAYTPAPNPSSSQRPSGSARADRLEERADRMTHRAEQVRAEANAPIATETAEQE